MIDHQWNDHVDSMNCLREGIYLRSYAQIKPEDATVRRLEHKHDGQHYRSGSADAAAHSEARAAAAGQSGSLTRNHFKKRERPVFHLEIPIRFFTRS
ncbi:MAG: hypothetical protein ACLVJ6_02855 [Merdibacter sp.]